MMYHFCLLSMLASSALGQAVNCDENPISLTFDEAAFNKLVKTWHGAFGGGAGWLGQPDGSGVTSQAVCCKGWYLVANYTAKSDREWTGEEFKNGADRLKADGGGPQLV